MLPLKRVLDCEAMTAGPPAPGKVFEVKLSTHSAKGITDKDFELARKLEETLLWRGQNAPEAPLAKRVLRGPKGEQG